MLLGSRNKAFDVAKVARSAPPRTYYRLALSVYEIASRLLLDAALPEQTTPQAPFVVDDDVHDVQSVFVHVVRA